MTRRAVALVVLLLGVVIAWPAAHAPAQDPARDPEPAGQAEIRGRVLSSGRGTPLSGATVQATQLVPMPGRTRSVKTEDDGKLSPRGALRPWRPPPFGGRRR